MLLWSQWGMVGPPGSSQGLSFAFLGSFWLSVMLSCAQVTIQRHLDQTDRQKRCGRQKATAGQDWAGWGTV